MVSLFRISPMSLLLCNMSWMDDVLFLLLFRALGISLKTLKIISEFGWKAFG